MPLLHTVWFYEFNIHPQNSFSFCVPYASSYICIQNKGLFHSSPRARAFNVNRATITSPVRVDQHILYIYIDLRFQIQQASNSVLQFQQKSVLILWRCGWAHRVSSWNDLLLIEHMMNTVPVAHACIFDQAYSATHCGWADRRASEQIRLCNCNRFVMQTAEPAAHCSYICMWIIKITLHKHADSTRGKTSLDDAFKSYVKNKNRKKKPNTSLMASIESCVCFFFATTET